jgi:hypothetical protein
MFDDGAQCVVAYRTIGLQELPAIVPDVFAAGAFQDHAKITTRFHTTGSEKIRAAVVITTVPARG